MVTDVSFIERNHTIFNTLIGPAGRSLQKDINLYRKSITLLDILILIC